MPAERVLYYALGGGRGHAARGLALLRRLPPGVPRLLLVPRRLSSWARAEGVPAAGLPAGEWTPETLGRWVLTRLRAFRPTLLLVDVFPAGVLDELGERHHRLAGRSWLVSRLVRPAYYLARRRELERRYAGLLWAEEPPAALRSLALRQERVPPLLVRAPAECLSRAEARRRLGLPLRGKAVIALGVGEPLARAAAKACARLGARLRWLHGEDGAMGLLPAADAVVSAAGYHSVHEARALGLPLVCVPRDKPVDDQRRRAAAERVARGPEELERELRRALSAPRRRPRRQDGPGRAWRVLLAGPGAGARSRSGTGRSARR